MEIKELLEELEKKLVEKGLGVFYGPMYAETKGKKGIAISVISDFDPGTSDGQKHDFGPIQQGLPGLGGPMKTRTEEDEDGVNVGLHKLAARLRGRIRVHLLSIAKLDEDVREKVMPEREELMDYMRLLSHRRNVSKQTIEEVETNVDCVEEVLKKK